MPVMIAVVVMLRLFFFRGCRAFPPLRRLLRYLLNLLSGGAQMY
jgi:hypothetical protein